MTLSSNWIEHSFVYCRNVYHVIYEVLQSLSNVVLMLQRPFRRSGWIRLNRHVTFLREVKQMRFVLYIFLYIQILYPVTPPPTSFRIPSTNSTDGGLNWDHGQY